MIFLTDIITSCLNEVGIVKKFNVEIFVNKHVLVLLESILTIFARMSLCVCVCVCMYGCLYVRISLSFIISNSTEHKILLFCIILLYVLTKSHVDFGQNLPTGNGIFFKNFNILAKKYRKYGKNYNLS